MSRAFPTGIMQSFLTIVSEQYTNLPPDSLWDSWRQWQWWERPLPSPQSKEGCRRGRKAGRPGAWWGVTRPLRTPQRCRSRSQSTRWRYLAPPLWWRFHLWQSWVRQKINTWGVIDLRTSHWTRKQATRYVSQPNSNVPWQDIDLHLPLSTQVWMSTWNFER